MTKADAERMFCDSIGVQIHRQDERNQGGIDWPWRRMAWNDWTDELQKSGRITAKQYDSWGPPRCAQRKKRSR